MTVPMVMRMVQMPGCRVVAMVVMRRRTRHAHRRRTKRGTHRKAEMNASLGTAAAKSSHEQAEYHQSAGKIVFHTAYYHKASHKVAFVQKSEKNRNQRRRMKRPISV